MWSYETSQYKIAQVNTNAMHDAIDANAHGSNWPGPTTRTYMSRVDSTASSLPLRAIVTATDGYALAPSTFDFTEQTPQSNDGYHKIKYNAAFSLELTGNRMGLCSTGPCANSASGTWIISDAQNCAATAGFTKSMEDSVGTHNALRDEALAFTGPASSMGYKATWVAPAAGNSVTGTANFATENVIESIVGRAVVVFDQTGVRVGCGLIERNWWKDTTSVSDNVVTTDPDAFSAGSWSSGIVAGNHNNPAVGDSRRQLSTKTTITVAVKCDSKEQCDDLKSSLDNCQSTKDYFSTQGVSVKCPETTSPFPTPVVNNVAVPGVNTVTNVGKTVYRTEYGTLIQQSALEKKYEHATIVLGVFCFVLLVLVIFLVVRSPSGGEKQNQDAAVRGSQLEGALVEHNV